MYLFIEKPHPGKRLQVRTQYVFPPIADRSMDWSAVVRGYEPGDAIGRGETEAEAINDLLNQA